MTVADLQRQAAKRAVQMQDVPAAQRVARNSSKQDLRAWLEELRAAGEVQEISGAERETEIGGIVDLYMRKMGNQAVLFDDIPGYPRGHRILANILTSVRRINLTLGLPLDGSAIELVSYWRKYMKEAKSIPPVTVKSGPLLENVFTGKDIDIQKIPTPRWHEHDGGYYIGTGCMVIMKDPDTGWINYGAYRVQSHGPNLATVMCSKGKHGDLIKRRYHERGEPCPIAVVVGMHPALFMVAGLEIPYGKNEYDVAGGLIGEPVEVIKGPVHRAADSGAGGDRVRGLRASRRSDRRGPARRMDRLLRRRPEEGAGDPHRDLHASQRPDPARRHSRPCRPTTTSFYRGTYRSGAVWNQLEAAGVPEVKGVWAHAAGGSRLWLTVAIKQQYGGHAKQAGLIASQCHAGAYANRVVVVVDDDIDPADMDQVVWAMCTRFEPREGHRGPARLLEHGARSDGLRQRRPAQRARRHRCLQAVVAPRARSRSWRARARSSTPKIRAKWAHVLPKG